VIWLIGNKGMLGTELSELLSSEKIGFVGTDRDVSILDPAALAAFAAGKRIDWIVNCAAYTAVDKAEDEPDLARELNALGPENIGKAARAIGARVLHISTDYVFDGEGKSPYREDDPVAPTGVYGRTKAEGEARLLAACPESVIVRTAWLYGKHGKNFVYTMLRIMRERGKASVVADQRGSPTWAGDLARAVVAVLRAPEPRYGIYHFTGEGETNWHEFAREIERLGREYGLLAEPAEVEPLTSAQYPSKVKRPAYSVLSKEKIKSAYGVEAPEWRSSLRAFMRDLRDTGMPSA
jgi:dTDP-4-dehydrorhamnose reductase